MSDEQLENMGDIDPVTGNFLRRLKESLDSIPKPPTMPELPKKFDLPEGEARDRIEKQKEFEETTKIKFTEFSKLPDKIDFKKDGFVQDSNMIDPGGYYSISYWTPEVLCSYFNGVDDGQYPDDFSVLEVGGGDQSASLAFKGRTNYTDIDRFQKEVYEEGWAQATYPHFHNKIEDELGHKENGKLYENMLMDALDIPDKFQGRTYDFMFAQGLFGIPTQLGGSEKYGWDKSGPAKYEKDILVAMKSALRDGGIIALASRDRRFNIDFEQLGEIGFDFTIKHIDSKESVGYPYLILRKIPQAELKEIAENSNQEGASAT